MDKTAQAVENYTNLELDGLVCIGGGGTQENSFRLMNRGIPHILTIPKTIDNDIAGTDVCFGYDSAMAIASEAIDRLHTTASSHHRCMIVDVMGNNAGWLALGAGVAGGADIILVPEWPFYQEELIMALERRRALGKLFSIVVVAEGAKPYESSLGDTALPHAGGAPANLSSLLATFIQDELGIETRVTSLGHVQRGGTPTPRDRFLATLLGTKAAEEVMAERFGTMVAVKGEAAIPVPLEEVAGEKKVIPLDHPWVTMARQIGISLGQ
jgi:6-phosphofructokinase 1